MYIFYTYSRSNHFKEYLNRIQGKEDTKIPNDLLNVVKKYLINKNLNVTPYNIRISLKENKFMRYYEHIDKIYHILANIEYRKLSVEDEKKACELFNKISISFDKCSQIHFPERKNFLNYSYLIDKISDLLELDLGKLDNLSSSRKNQYNDVRWKCIAEDLGLPHNTSLKTLEAITKIQRWWKIILAKRQLTRLKIKDE